jgi:hypothetical protein
VSRGQYDAQIYTDNIGELARDLSRDLLRPTATEAKQGKDSGQMNESKIGDKSQEPQQEQVHGIGLAWLRLTAALPISRSGVFARNTLPADVIGERLSLFGSNSHCEIDLLH